MLDKLVNLYKKNCNVQSSIKKYIKHNKKFFSISKETYSHELFLVEFNHWQVIHVMNSYLIDAYKKKKNLRFIAFETFRSLNVNKNYFFDNIKWKIATFFGLNNFGIYKSFGVSNFLYSNFDKRINYLSKLEFNKFFLKKNVTKKDVEDYTINKI
jgi:hypothetical protein